MKDIPSRLKELRETLSLSQQDLARHAGDLSRAAVHQWESGATKPGWEALDALQRSLSVNPSWIMRGDGAMFLESGGPSLTSKQAALIGIFEGLTSTQQDQVIRELDDLKRKNEEIIKELTSKKA